MKKKMSILLFMCSILLLGSQHSFCGNNKWNGNSHSSSKCQRHRSRHKRRLDKHGQPKYQDSLPSKTLAQLDQEGTDIMIELVCLYMQKIVLCCCDTREIDSAIKDCKNKFTEIQRMRKQILDRIQRS